jgi:hypothetical protein
MRFFMVTSNDFFWGVLITFFGVSLLLKALFKIDIQFFSLFFGMLLVYWGLTLIFPELFRSFY